MSHTWRRVSHNSVSGSAYPGGEGWEQSGTDWGNGTKPITVWYRDREYVVFKVPSGKHWSSILAPSVSHPGSYLVQRIAEDRGDTLITEPLFEMALSKRGRTTA